MARNDRNFTVIVLFDSATGAYYADIPTLGIIAQGDTVEHAFEMVADAIVGRLNVMAKDGDLIPTEVQPPVVRVMSI